MVVQYIFCESYVFGKRFVLPRESLDGLTRGYEIFRDEETFKCFYRDESDGREVVLNRWDVPKGAREMEFREMDFHGEKLVGGPVYYDSKGNVLREGNREGSWNE